MIELTDLNEVEFTLNSYFIESIKYIPETKVTMTNGNFYLVLEKKEEIIDKIISYNKKIYSDLIRIK